MAKANSKEREIKTGGTMFRKIFAITTENDFYKFRARASREGYSLAEALTAVVHKYANDRELKLPKKVGKSPKITEESQK